MSFIQENHPAPTCIPLEPGQKWVNAAHTASEGHSNLNIWNIEDSAEKIIHRLLSKRIDINIAHDILSTNPGANQVREIFISQILAPGGIAPTETVTVPVLEVKKMPGKNYGWVAYMPYFAFGSLAQFISEQDVGIPEPFAWYLFQRLAKSCVYMQEPLKSHKLNDGDNNDGNKNHRIVHLDIKPENVFLGTPGILGRDAEFPLYPPVYLGDFGSSLITHDNDDIAARRSVGWGTPSWFAPEVYGYVPEDQDGNKLLLPRQPWQSPADTYTNIWQVGNLMIAVLKKKVGDGEDIDWHEMHKTQFAPCYTEGDASNISPYSKDLLDLINQCVKCSPDQRTTPKDLLNTIEAKMYKHTKNMQNWGTEAWYKEKKTELTNLNFKLATSRETQKYLTGAGIKKAAKKHYKENHLQAYLHAQCRWKQIISQQIHEGKRVNLWNREPALKNLDVEKKAEEEEVLQEGLETLICEEENMLFFPKIDTVLEGDWYWEQGQSKPLEFQVKEEYAREWVEEMNAKTAGRAC